MSATLRKKSFILCALFIGLCLYLFPDLLVPGFRLSTASAQTTTSTGDPGELGPFASTYVDYVVGTDSEYKPPSGNGLTNGMPTEVRGRVYHPINMQSGGPFPLIVLLHGRHAVCSNGRVPQPVMDPSTGQMTWPCKYPYDQPIWSYQGYEVGVR